MALLASCPPSNQQVHLEVGGVAEAPPSLHPDCSMQRSCHSGHPHPALLPCATPHRAQGHMETPLLSLLRRDGLVYSWWPLREMLHIRREPGSRWAAWPQRRQLEVDRQAESRRGENAQGFSMGECGSQSVGLGSSLREEV